MSYEGPSEELKGLARKWEAKVEAVNRWREEHIAVWWVESEPAPPEPKAVTKEALAQFERVKAEEREAYEELRAAMRREAGA
jgi:hypothetical protein